jgi:hypothetical protein
MVCACSLLGFSGVNVMRGECMNFLHGNIVDISFQHRSCSIPYFCQSLSFDVSSAANVVVNCLFICLGDVDSSRNGRSWKWSMMLAHCLGFLIRGDALIHHGTILVISFQHHSLSIPYFFLFLLLNFLSAASMVLNCPFVRGLGQLQKRPIIESGLCMIAR